MQIRQS